MVLKFDQPFWPDTDVIGLVGGDQPVSMLINGETFADAPLLVGFRGGRDAREREALSDEEAVAQVVTALNAPNPTGALVTRWAADPFARGSYSFVAVGSSPDDMNALAEPVNERLAFAGEATVPGVLRHRPRRIPERRARGRPDSRLAGHATISGR